MIQDWTVFLDPNGHPRKLRGCPVAQFEDLQSLYSVYWTLVLELDPLLESSFFELIQEDSDLLQIANSIIEILGVKPDQISIDIMAAFIHSYVDLDGIPHKGYIWEKYFEKKEKPDNKTVTFEEYKSLLLASLSMSEGGLDKAIEIIKLMSIEDVNSYLKSRTEIINRGDDRYQKIQEINDAKADYASKFGNTPGTPSSV
jgi:wyosine [tRNA(Phe)-imidazoG37] synthetase (radical SAM superfamily)